MKQKGRRQGSISAAAFCPCFLTSHGGIYGRAEYSKAVLEWEVRKACTTSVRDGREPAQADCRTGRAENSISLPRCGNDIRLGLGLYRSGI